MNRPLLGAGVLVALVAGVWFALRSTQPSPPTQSAQPAAQSDLPAAESQPAEAVLQTPPAAVGNVAAPSGAARVVEPQRRLHEIFTRIPEIAELDVQPPQGPNGRCNGCLCTLKPPTYVWLHYWLDQLKTHGRGDDAMQVLEKYVLYREHCIGRGWTSLPTGEVGDYMYGWNGHVYAVRKADYPLLDRYETLRMDPDFDQKARMHEDKVREVSCYIEEGLKELAVRVDC